MKKIIDLVAYILVIVGALNWGLVGLFDFDIVATLFGTVSRITDIVYVLIGVSALWVIYMKVKK